MFHLSKSKHINFVALHRVTETIADGIFPFKKRRRLKHIYKILKCFSLIFIALLLILLILFSTKILGFKQYYSQAISGQANLKQAIIFAKQDEFSQAMVLAKSALNNFNFLADGLGQAKASNLANRLPFIKDQLNSLESLSAAAGLLSQAVYSGANFGKNISSLTKSGEIRENLIITDKKLKFSEFSPATRRQIFTRIFESAPELNGLKANLALAYLNLDQINASGVLFPFKEKINQTKKNIDEVSQILKKAVPVSQLLPALAGYPETAEYLVLFQDNRELWPTGGSLNTYGILRAKDGDLTSFITHDIHYLDTLAGNKIRVIPPEPINKYLVVPPARLAGGSFWRLANWSPNWPTAVSQMDWLYQRTNILNPGLEKISDYGGVIALNPKLITDLLKITGPITVSGRVYDQTNFLALFEPRLEEMPKGPKPKDIGKIILGLKNKIFDLPSPRWLEVISLIADNLEAKDILLYLNDKQLEEIVLVNGWGGEIKSTDGDYLMVVDANLGASKTDANLNRGLEYEITQGANGLFSKLSLNYAFSGVAAREIEPYKSYTRVYAPLGSQLINFSGYEPGQIEIGSEAGKTWFGFYLEVGPEKIKNLTIEYKLPALVMASKNYELYFQKQPGKEINEAKVDLNFLNDIKSYSPASLYMQKVGSAKIQWTGDLNIDRDFNVNF